MANTLTCFARLLVRLTLNAVKASDPSQAFLMLVAAHSGDLSLP